MTIQDRCDITPTWDMSEDEWREARFNGLGGSDIASAIGLNKYTSPYVLWAEKSRLVDSFEGNEATDWGHDLEDIVLLRTAKRRGIAIVQWPVLLRSKEHPFMTANLDGLVVEASNDFPAGQVTEWREIEEPPGALAVAEAKTGAIATPGRPQDWFQNGESVPITYECQGMWYMDVAGLPQTVYGALIGGHGLLTRTLDYSPSTAENLRRSGKHFWDRVLQNDPPPVDGSDSTEEALKALYPRHKEGRIYEGGQALLDIWQEFEAAKELAADADKTRKEMRAKIAILVGDAEFGSVDGESIFSFKASKDVERLDTERFKRECPEVYEQYKKVSPGSRQMRGLN